MLDAWNSYNDVCQSYLNKTKKRKSTIKPNSQPVNFITALINKNAINVEFRFDYTCIHAILFGRQSSQKSTCLRDYEKPWGIIPTVFWGVTLHNGCGPMKHNFMKYGLRTWTGPWICFHKASNALETSDILMISPVFPNLQSQSDYPLPLFLTFMLYHLHLTYTHVEAILSPTCELEQYLSYVVHFVFSLIYHFSPGSISALYNFAFSSLAPKSYQSILHTEFGVNFLKQGINQIIPN